MNDQAEHGGPAAFRISQVAKVALILAVAVMTCVLVGGGAWTLRHRSADGVRVTWESIECNTPRSRHHFPGEAAAFEARAGTRCTVEVKISSKHPVRLTQMVAPLLGPRSGAGMQLAPEAPGWNTYSTTSVANATTFDCVPLRQLHTSSGVDAVRAIDVTVSPSRPYTLDIPVIYRACADCPPESGMGFGVRLPEVKFTTWGRTYARSSDQMFRVEFPDGPEPEQLSPACDG